MSRKNLIDFLLPIYQNGLFYKVKAPTGCGKTEWVIEFIKDFLKKYEDGRVCLFSYRIILGMKLAEGLSELGFKFYMDGVNEKRIIISCESLHKWHYTINNSQLLLIFDEINSIVSHFSSSTMVGNFHSFKETFEVLATEADSVVTLDAYYNDSTNYFLERMFKDKTLANYEWPAGVNPVDNPIPSYLSYSSEDFYLRMKECLQNGENIYIWSGSKKTLNQMIGLLLKDGAVKKDEVLIVTAESPPIMKKKSGTNPNDHWSSYRVIGCTPCLISGVSYTRSRRAVFVICNFNIFPTPSDLMQAAGRIRAQTRLYIFLKIVQDDNLFPDTIEGVKQELVKSKIKKLQHLKNLLGIVVINQFQDGILSHIIRIRNDDLFSQTILRSLLEKFLFRNAPLSTIKEILVSDERYSTPHFRGVGALKALFFAEPYSKISVRESADEILSRSMNELTNSDSLSLFEAPVLEEFDSMKEVLSTRPADQAIFGALRILHAFRLIGTDLYDYHGVFKYDWFLRYTKDLCYMSEIVNSWINIHAFYRLKIYLNGSQEEVLTKEYLELLVDENCTQLFSATVSDVREILDAANCDFKKGIVPSSYVWSIGRLINIAKRMKSSIATCPVIKAANAVANNESDLGLIAEFIRRALASIGITQGVGKKRGRKNDYIYEQTNFFDNPRSWKNNFIVYMARRKRIPSGDIASSFFFFPLNEGYLHGCQFYCGYADPFKYINPDVIDQQIINYSKLKFEDYFNFNLDESLNSLTKWRWDHYDKILDFENLLAQKICFFKKRINLFFPVVFGSNDRDRDYWVVKRTEDKFVFKGNLIDIGKRYKIRRREVYLEEDKLDINGMFMRNYSFYVPNPYEMFFK